MCNILYLSTTALLLLAFPYASNAGKGGPEDIPSENRFNFFDAELLQAIANTNSGNVLVSPVSIKAVLALILEGAGGKSGEQIRTALRLPENQEAIQRVFYRFLTSVLEPTPGIKLEMASRVFMAKVLQPSHAYLTSLRQHYYSDLVKVDFTTPEITARIINDWIKQLTKGLIPKLVDAGSLQPDTQTVITNAVYFKGRWKIPFDQETTSVKCFYTSPGVCHNTNMMETLEFFNYNYIRELDADALEIPYQGNKFSMLLLAPKEVDGMVQLKRDIVHVPIHSIIASLEPTEVLVSLPRFEIDFSTDLVPTLHTLGIRDIFGPNSNLSGMFASSEASAQVSNVFHKAKIIVNEAGSEAAAGTGALVIPLMGSAISKFRADRPFLFFIRDMTSGITLFAGRVSVPEAASAQYLRPRPELITPSTADISGIFTDKFVSTLRPSQSNSGGGTNQNYRPGSGATTRRTRPASQARPTTTTAATTTTEGREIISFSSQNSPAMQTLQSSNLHYPSTAQDKMLSYNNPVSQNKNSQPSFSSQHEGNTHNFNSPNPSTSTNSNPQGSFNYQNLNRPQQSFSQQNPNVQYSQSTHAQQNSQITPQQHVPNSQTASHPEFNRPSLIYQSSSVNQLNPQNPSPSYIPNSNSNTPQYSSNLQSSNQQANLRDASYQNPQFVSNNQNSAFKSQNSLPNKPVLYNREMQQHPPIQNTNNNAQYQPATQPLYLHYPIPGNTAEYLSNTRESQQASSQRSPTYSVVVKNETPLQAPGSQSTYQQPQSQDRDAILFSSQHTA